MRLNINKKYINTIAFVLILVLGLILVGQLHKHFSGAGSLAPKFYYLITGFVIVISFAQLMFNLIAKEEGISTESEEIDTIAISDHIDDNEETEQKDKAEETSKEADKDVSVDYKEVIGKIIPPKQPSVELFGEKLLTNIAQELKIVQGIFSVKNISESIFSSIGFYAYFSNEKPKDFKVGETLPGQVAKNKITMQLSNIPDGYINVVSGLGEGMPNHLLIIPILKDEETIGIMEIASFKKLDTGTVDLIENIAGKISGTLYSYIKGTENVKNDEQ